MPDSVCMIRHLDVHIFRTVIFGHAQSSRKQSTRNASSLVSRFFCGMCGTHTHTVGASRCKSTQICSRTYAVVSSLHTHTHEYESRVCESTSGSRTWCENRRRFTVAIEREIFGNEFVDDEIRVVVVVFMCTTTA